eukprot:COSAG01_NODE_31964_length_588_cov_2.271984_1_plen_188_part_10
MAAWPCTARPELARLQFRTPEFSFLGPTGALRFVSGVHQSCDLLGGDAVCEQLQEGEWHSPDRWLVEFIQRAYNDCSTGGLQPRKPCLSFDFGSNLGLVAASMAQQGSSIIAVEPQVDLCCAGETTTRGAQEDAFTMASTVDSPVLRSLFLCGGVSVSPLANRTMVVSPTSYRSHNKSFDMANLYKSL